MNFWICRPACFERIQGRVGARPSIDCEEEEEAVLALAIFAKRLKISISGLHRNDRHCGGVVKVLYLARNTAGTCQAWLRRMAWHSCGKNRDSLEIFGRPMVLVHVEQSAGIKYSLWLHETITTTTHNINSWDSPSVLLMSTLTPILTPPITASTSSVIFICRPTQALEASINLKITSTGITSHSRHYSSTLTHSLTSFKTGPLTARCKELTH